MTEHEKYIVLMKRLKATPPYMNEKQLNEALGIRKKEVEPLVITPRNQQKPMKPTIENHDKVKKVKRIRLPKQKSEPKPKKEPITKKDPKSTRAKATDLSGLTKEQKAAHHKAKALERYYTKKSPNVRVKMTDEERKEKRSKYEKSRRDKMKAEGTWKRKPLTEEQKQQHKDYKTQQRREQGIMPRTKMSPEEKKAKLLQQSKEWRQRCKEKGIKRVLTDEQRERYNANYRAKAKLKKESK